MKKLLKLITVCVLCIAIVIGIVGCKFDIVYLIDSKAVEEEEKIPKVAFGWKLSDDVDGIKKLVTAEEFDTEKIEYNIYRSDFHYSKLNEDEKFLYRCFEYALENGYPCIYVDDLITPAANAFGKILSFLALDSPLLEQNLIYETGTFTTYYDTDLSRQAKLDGVYLYIENSNPALWDGKLEAIKRAKEIVDSIPEGFGEVEKAKYLHKYTVENVEYHDYNSSDAVWQYLRDAVIDGKGNCDGSANMLSLLLNMAGIECFEKMHTNNIVGHTWNMAKLDGIWYNIDATAQNKYQTEDMSFYIKRNFAFDDGIQKYLPDYNEIYPVVNEGLEIKVNIHIESIDKDSFLYLVKSTFDENGGNYALLLVDDYTEVEATEAMQRLADFLKTKVYWYSYEVVGNKTVMAVYY